MRTTPWTPSQDAMLTDLWCKDGLSASVVALRLTAARPNITRNAVIARLHRLGISRIGGTRQDKATSRKNFRSTIIKSHVARGHKIKPRPERSVARDLTKHGTFEPLPLPADETPPAKLVALIDLDDAACRWPFGERPTMFGCVGPKVSGLPYCAGHAAKAYRVADPAPTQRQTTRQREKVPA